MINQDLVVLNNRDPVLKTLHMVSLILIIAAAFFKSVADTLQHHYETSVFKNMAYKYWNPNESWKYVKYIPLTKYRPDAWHLANTGMIFCFVFAAVFHSFVFVWWVEFGILGVAFYTVFNLFYNKILR